MAEFDFDGIPIKLPRTGHTIMVMIRHDYSPEGHSVVFADAKKLQPYMDKINARQQPGYLASKRAGAQNGFLLARTILGDNEAVCENPLPMARVSCYLLSGKPHIGFSDGITRTTEMLSQGAEYVPLEVSSSEAKLLHQTVGGKLAPKSAAFYVVPPDVRMERMIAYNQSRRGSVAKYE